MKICVFGLWHLGSVTAACLSSLNQKVIGLDFNKRRIEDINKGKLPISEPCLDEMTSKSVKAKNLIFIHDLKDLPKKIDYLWVTHDTPVNFSDKSNTNSVLIELNKVLRHVHTSTTVIISSQLPAGTARRLEKKYKSKFDFAVVPENLRLGNAINTFFNQDRLIVGISNSRLKIKLKKLINDS